METKFNFKSQICTSIDQSRRLLELGLKKETADMMHEGMLEGELPRIMPYKTEMDYFNLWDSITPAWSLHRLIEMMPNKTGDYELNINALKVGYYSCVGWGYSFDLFEKEGEVFICLIDCIEWLIKEGYFPKEYLV